MPEHSFVSVYRCTSRNIVTGFSEHLHTAARGGLCHLTKEGFAARFVLASLVPYQNETLWSHTRHTQQEYMYTKHLMATLASSSAHSHAHAISDVQHNA